MPQPNAEVFGIPISDTWPAAQQLITDKICPFHNKETRCTKDRKADPLGVCSVLEADTAHITCPVRFRQDWRIIRDAADFFFELGARTEFVSEAYVKDVEGRTRGKVDHAMLKLDANDNILDFGSLEVQAVYVTGNIRNPFARYIQTRDPHFTWHGPNYPSPDYLSSAKRLAQQIYVKGSILKGWNKKQAVALQTSFYATLPQLDRVPKEQADIAWLLYEMRFDEARNRYDLVLVDTVYSLFEEALERISVPKGGDMEPFVATLRDKLRRKRRGLPTEDVTKPTLTD
jgi:hypothetical protein